MVLLQNQRKPFINYGPQKLNACNHRTRSSLLIYTDDKNDLKFLRAHKDLYPYNTNFADLPEYVERTAITSPNEQ